MAKAQAKVTTDGDLASILVDLADRGHVDNEAGFPADDRIVLNVRDLVEDANGEVVLFNDSHLPRLALESDVAEVGRGEAGPHVTASGDDVSGFHYIAFDNGLTLYFQDGLDLVLVGPGHTV